jgi:hypothetical protein
LALLIESQLFAQEEVLSGQRGSGLKETSQEPNKVHSELEEGQGDVREAFA